MNSLDNARAERNAYLRSARIAPILWAALAFGQPQMLLAAGLYWDGDGAGTQDGGVGNWNPTVARWSTTDEGTTFLPWVNNLIVPDSAIFDDVAATVMVDGDVTVNSLTFSPNPSADYTLAGGSTITFAGPSPTITVNTTGSTKTTLSTVYTGTGPITKMGAGRLDLDAAANTLSGGYIINQGSINLPAADRLGTGAANPVTLDPHWLIFAGGGLSTSNAAAQDLGPTRGITLAGNAYLGSTNQSNPVTISAPITGTGDVYISGVTPGSPFGGGMNSGGTWTLSNTNNNWIGNIHIDAGVLQLGASDVIPDTAVVVSHSGATAFRLNGFNETVKSISGGNRPIYIFTGTLTIEDPAGEEFTGSFVVNPGGKVIKNGSGLLTLAGPSNFTFDGEFILNSGTLGIGFNTIFGDGTVSIGQVTINGGKLASTSGSKSIPAPIPLRLNGDFTVDDSLSPFNSQISFNGPTTIRNSNRTITVSPKATFTMAGAVGQDVTGRSLTKDGSGILALTNAANTYSGDTTILAGQLNVDGDGSLGDGTGTLHLSGGKLNATASRTVATPNPIDVTADSSITTSSAAAVVNFEFASNGIGGTAGTLTLRNNGADSSTDRLDVRLSGSGFTFSRPIVIDNGSVGQTNLSSFNVSPGVQTFSAAISGSGSYNRSASAGNGGTTVFTAANSYSGGTTVNNGTLDVQSDGGLGTGNVTINTNGTLKLEMGSANSYISSSADLVFNDNIPMSPNLATANLNFTGTPNTIQNLSFDNGATFAASGTWGAVGNMSADHTDPHLTGMGLLLVGRRATQWRNRRVHNGTPLDIVINSTNSGNGSNGPTVDPRQGGIARIEVDFSASVTLLDPSKIYVEGRLTSGGSMGSPVPVTPDSVVAVDGDTIAIIFSTPLADQTCYRIELQNGLIAELLSGDLDVSIRELIGDSTGSGDIALSDALLIKAHNSDSASNGPQWDLDLSGTVDSADALYAKSRVSFPAKSALCP